MTWASGSKDVGKHQGHHSSGVVDVCEEQVGQEEIHWGVEGAVGAYHPDDGCIATNDCQAEAEEEEGLEFRDSGGHPNTNSVGPD